MRVVGIEAARRLATQITRIDILLEQRARPILVVAQVALQPGLANQINSFASMYADSSTGLIQNQITVLSNQDTDWNTQVAQIQSDSQNYQTQLINKYALMEQQVAAQQLVQQQIKAIMQSQYSTGG